MIRPACFGESCPGLSLSSDPKGLSLYDEMTIAARPEIGLQ
jgi:hypothetical protein